jgi:Xaa-Pro aminopeptidase
VNDRLLALRAILPSLGIDGFIVPRADEHLGEYVPAAAERLAWLTGFTGSAGLAVVLPERAAVWSDGRYVLQLEAQVDNAAWERLHISETPPPDWLVRHAAGLRIGYDPWLISEDGLARFAAAGLVMVPVAANPVDAVWTSRPAPPLAPAVPHPLRFAGVASADKRAAAAAELRAAGQDGAVLTDPASIAWLLNLRGGDVAYIPFALGFALLDAAGEVDLFMDRAKLSPELLAWLGEEVRVHAPAALPAALAGLAGRTVRVDSAGSPVWFAQALRAVGATVVSGTDPCLLPKACKNPTEQAGTRAAHARDAVALCRFLHWLDSAAGHATELSAAARLLAFRQEVEGFREESFPAITGAGEDGAIIHYRATPATDRPLRADETYLTDSGAQYPDGTTDVTRTIWTGPGTPPELLRDRFTRVLQGHIALATLRFPEGVAGPHLDGFARRALWDAGLDYDHGTGHGVGSYLSVHEGPVSLSRAARPQKLLAGMILSNEPGYYEPGAYGIRLENLLLVQPDPAAARRFLRFETLTLAPFDRRLVATGMLTRAERAWLDAYHARVRAEVGPHVPAEVLAWLEAATAPLADDPAG